MDSIAAEYGVYKGTVCLSSQWVEDGTFALPGKQKLKRKPASILYMVVDMTENTIHLPTKRTIK